jgi:hypothetical protein
MSKQNPIRRQPARKIRDFSDRLLALPGGTVRGGLFGQTGPSVTADKADGGAVDPQAHAQSVRRGALRALSREPVLSAFCGEEFFRHKLPFDRSSLTRWRQRMGEALSEWPSKEGSLTSPRQRQPVT